jgi:hypothetical protein
MKSVVKLSDMQIAAAKDYDVKNERLKREMRFLLARIEEAEDADAEGIIEIPNDALDDLKTAKDALARLVDSLGAQAED